MGVSGDGMDNNLNSPQEDNEMSLHLDANIEWCLTFNDNLSKIEIEDDTPCVLHGRIVWQDLTCFKEKCASGGKCLENQLSVFCNNDSGVIQNGISSTIGELREGTMNARLTLEYLAENNHQQVSRNISWNKVAQAPLKPFIKTIQRKIFDGRLPDEKTVVFSGFTHNSSFFEQKSLKYKAALAAARGVPISDIPQSMVHDYLVKEVIDRKEYIGNGSDAKFSLFNGYGEIVSTKTITATN